MSIRPRWASWTLSSRARPVWTPTNFRSTTLVAINYRMMCSSLDISRLIGDEAKVTFYPVMSMPFGLSHAISELHMFRMLPTPHRV